MSRRKLLWIASTIVLLPAVAVIACNAAAPHWVRQDRLARADAIVIMGGSRSADRILAGLTLWQQGLAPVILAADSGLAGYQGEDQSTILELAHATSAVRSVGRVHTTREEAVAIARVARDSGYRSLIVVTSPLHTRRACKAIEQATATNVLCAAAKERSPITVGAETIPDRLWSAWAYTYERAAWWKYRYAGWVR